MTVYDGHLRVVLLRKAEHEKGYMKNYKHTGNKQSEVKYKAILGSFKYTAKPMHCTEYLKENTKEREIQLINHKQNVLELNNNQYQPKTVIISLRAKDRRLEKGDEETKGFITMVFI